MWGSHFISVGQRLTGGPQGNALMWAVVGSERERRALKILNSHVLVSVLDLWCKSFIVQSYPQGPYQNSCFIDGEAKAEKYQKHHEGHTVSYVAQSPWCSHGPRRHQQGALSD